MGIVRLYRKDFNRKALKSAENSVQSNVFTRVLRTLIQKKQIAESFEQLMSVKKRPQMGWHYQIRRKRDKHTGRNWYDIVEVFGPPFGHTESGIVPESETRKGVIETLERMLGDARKRKTLIEKEE